MVQNGKLVVIVCQRALTRKHRSDSHHPTGSVMVYNEVRDGHSKLEVPNGLRKISFPVRKNDKRGLKIVYYYKEK